MAFFASVMSNAATQGFANQYEGKITVGVDPSTDLSTLVYDLGTADVPRIEPQDDMARAAAVWPSTLGLYSSGLMDA